MIALATLLVVVLVSLLVTRVATVMLTLTGLSHEVARFQARSALSGAGFTTSEAESVVSHPVRRRVIAMLMLLGSAGIVTVMATLVLSFSDASGERLERLLVLVAGLAVLVAASRSALVDRVLLHVIERALRRWTNLDVRDYARLLHLGGEYQVLELQVQPQDWVAERTLGELTLRDEGVAVLGVVRPDGTFVGAPIGATRVAAGDTLVLYGRAPRLRELDERRSGAEGDEAHRRAVAEEARARAEQVTQLRDEPGA